MTRSELEQLTECGHDLAAKVALAIIAAAQVGPSTVEMQVDVDTIETVAECLGLTVNRLFLHRGHRAEITLSFMEVDAVIYARAQR
jgi:hypothetical protein